MGMFISLYMLILNLGAVSGQNEEIPGSVLWQCDFEPSDSCGASSIRPSDYKDSYAWLRIKGRTPSSNTGPDDDHTDGGEGYYVYTEASPPRQQGESTNFSTPIVSTRTSDKTLEFWYFMYGVGVGELSVYLRNQSGAFKVTETDISGNQGRAWKRKVVRLPAGEYSIHFLSRRGDNWDGDIAIDDVSVRVYLEKDATKKPRLYPTAQGNEIPEWRNGAYWVKKIGRYMPGNNEENEFGITIEECLERCVTMKTFVCKSVDYIAELDECIWSRANREMAAIRQNDRFEYYERVELDDYHEPTDGPRPTDYPSSTPVPGDEVEIDVSGTIINSVTGRGLYYVQTHLETLRGGSWVAVDRRMTDRWGNAKGLKSRHTHLNAAKYKLTFNATSAPEPISTRFPQVEVMFMASMNETEYHFTVVVSNHSYTVHESLPVQHECDGDSDE